MHKEIFKISAKIWLYSGQGAWHFVTLPEPVARDIDNLFGHAKRGWGSLPVTVTLGGSTWTTSIFPDKKSSSYLLPLKASVRKAEAVGNGDTVEFTLNIEA